MESFVSAGTIDCGPDELADEPPTVYAHVSETLKANWEDESRRQTLLDITLAAAEAAAARDGYSVTDWGVTVDAENWPGKVPDPETGALVDREPHVGVRWEGRIVPEAPMYGFYPVEMRDGAPQVAAEPVREVPLEAVTLNKVLKSLVKRFGRPRTTLDMLRRDVLLHGNAYMTDQGERVDPLDVVTWRHPDESTTFRTSDGQRVTQAVLPAAGADLLAPAEQQDALGKWVADAFRTSSQVAESAGWRPKGRRAHDYDVAEEATASRHDYEPQHRANIDGPCTHDYCACLDIRDSDDHCPCYRDGGRCCCCKKDQPR
jgi:hypothetical protein